MSAATQYNFAYLDEETKRMIRNAILKAVAIPGYFAGLLLGSPSQSVLPYSAAPTMVVRVKR